MSSLGNLLWRLPGKVHISAFHTCVGAVCFQDMQNIIFRVQLELLFGPDVAVSTLRTAAADARKRGSALLTSVLSSPSA